MSDFKWPSTKLFVITVAGFQINHLTSVQVNSSCFTTRQLKTVLLV